MAGIKETMEVIAAAKALGVAIKASKDGDGKISILDLPKFAPVVVAGLQAANGSEAIAGEIKDLSAEEAKEALTAAIEAVTVLVESLLK